MKKMPIWWHEIVLKFQTACSSTQIMQWHQLLNLQLLWRNLHHFWSYSKHSHTRSLLLRGLCYCFTIHMETGGCAFLFWGNIGPKAVRGVQICIVDANATRLCFTTEFFPRYIKKNWWWARLQQPLIDFTFPFTIVYATACLQKKLEFPLFVAIHTLHGFLQIYEFDIYEWTINKCVSWILKYWRNKLAIAC